MGKIKVRTLGTEDEQLQKNEQKKKSEGKRLAKVQGSGGQRIPEVGPSEEELARLDSARLAKLDEKPVEEKEEGQKKTKKEKFQKAKRTRSAKYQTMTAMIDKSKKYSVSEGLQLLEEMKSPAKKDSALQKKTFDETVELHLNTADPKIATSTTLPHKTGKTLRVAIASDELITEVEAGKINFDILLATPLMMPKLAKVAKTLGPKGLMPNPKNGTITNAPEEAAKKYEGGLTFIKTEAKAPLIHIAVGKVSFGPKKLEENITAIIDAVKKENISDATLKSTMSPAIKLQL